MEESGSNSLNHITKSILYLRLLENTITHTSETSKQYIKRDI